MIKLDNINLSISYNENEIKEKCSKKLNISPKNIKNIEIIKLSLDARRKNNIHYQASIALNLDKNIEQKFPELDFFLDKKGLEYPQKNIQLSPVIIGFGPSGMFAGLALAKMGLKPIIIEQGKDVEARQDDVDKFWKEGKLNVYSNVQFGEGGAGTFSDGKLNSNISNFFCKKVINEFIIHGAPKEIFYLSKPHIGSDNLKTIVKSIRNETINLGGKILFSHKFCDFFVENNKLTSVSIQNLINNQIISLETNHLLLCIGHSARDTFKLLYEKSVDIKQKPFAMGVRIEQKQKQINIGQYGINYDKNLPNADYKLVCHLPSGRSVFTFCMCPGGYVVSSSSGEGEIVTNGMSNFARDNIYANSALLVNVMPEDFSSSHPLAGIEFQAKYEKLAYNLGGGNFKAPAQSVGEFLGKDYKIDRVITTYKPSITHADISKCLPEFVSESLKDALPILNQKLNGFAQDDNLLIAIESRSSCPLTIVRDENFMSSVQGIYPVGEGAGYAGGIMSSAQDGIKVAQSIYDNLM